MLHDPAANRFFQLGWPAFELLSRWSLDDPRSIVAAVNRETTLRVSMDDFEALLGTLRQHNLLVSQSAADTERLRASVEAGRLSHAMWLLKHYLLIRIPLWRPTPFLRRFLRHVAFAYRPLFWGVVAAGGVVGLALVSRQWDTFIHTFHSYADLTGLLAVGVALAFAKVLHEFGHAFTAYRYGCRVPTMGIGFLVMFPVLYTDTTEAWKLPRRADRLRIGAAGMLSEIALAVAATLAWSLLSDGPLRAAAFLLATTTWIATLAINASPFMRFDGYFLLSDWLELPNLHDRAFRLARWWLREWLFGYGDPQPEPCALSRRRFLITFSFVTWLYRLVVFFSIALIVYHAFFKALGIALFAVEIGWFIARPVVREVAACGRRRSDIRWRPQTVRSALLGVLLFAVLVVPWHGGVSAPAVFGPEQAHGLYTPEPGYLSDQVMPPHNGQHVRKGELLALLVSPDLEYKRRDAQVQEKILRWEVESQAFDDRLREQGVALRRHWDAARQTVTGLDAQIERLEIRAPIEGTVEMVDEGLLPNTWLPRGERLFDLVGPNGIKGDAFVGESDIKRVSPGDVATFVASLPEMSTLRCRATAVDRVNLTVLDQPSVASPYGGPIPAEIQQNTHQLVPLRATYRVRIGECTGPTTLTRQLTGTVMIGEQPESFAFRGIRTLFATLEREAGL
jgi:putative peptide zinc metalloprotease protein